MEPNKKLYFSLHSEDGLEGTMELSGIMEFIKNDTAELNEGVIDGREYVIYPVFLTEEEYENLPEL